jgi:hypothetical protein
MVETGPILRFESDEQLQSSLFEWSQRLFLKDWYICAALVKPEDKDCDGENEYNSTNRSSLIRILRDFPETDHRAFKNCAEQTLVHELLHLKIDIGEDEPKTVEERLYQDTQHALIDQLARSFICAKYNLSTNWFYALR